MLCFETQSFVFLKTTNAFRNTKVCGSKRNILRLERQNVELQKNINITCRDPPGKQKTGADKERSSSPHRASPQRQQLLSREDSEGLHCDGVDGVDCEKISEAESGYGRGTGCDGRSSDGSPHTENTETQADVAAMQKQCRNLE